MHNLYDARKRSCYATHVIAGIANRPVGTDELKLLKLISRYCSDVIAENPFGMAPDKLLSCSIILLHHRENEQWAFR